MLLSEEGAAAVEDGTEGRDPPTLVGKVVPGEGRGQPGQDPDPVCDHSGHLAAEGSVVL